MHATSRGTQDTAPLEDTAPLDLEDETDEEEDDYADTVSSCPIPT